MATRAARWRLLCARGGDRPIGCARFKLNDRFLSVHPSGRVTVFDPLPSFYSAIWLPWISLPTLALFSMTLAWPE